jgi:hypothetical protein
MILQLNGFLYRVQHTRAGPCEQRSVVIQSHHPLAIVAVWSSGIHVGCLIHGKNILDVIIDLVHEAVLKKD